MIDGLPPRATAGSAGRSGAEAVGGPMGGAGPTTGGILGRTIPAARVAMVLLLVGGLLEATTAAANPPQRPASSRRVDRR